MAVLAGQRLLSAELVLDAAAVALSLPLGIKVLTALMDLVGRFELPLILLSVCRISSLVLVSFLARTAVLCLA
jgi:hypothetical protein